MAFRTVTGQFFRAGSLPWAGGEVWFTLQAGSYSASAHYPRDSIKAIADLDGRISVSLWVNEEGQLPTHWLCRQPSGESFLFSVPAGAAPISIEALRALGNPPLPPSPGLGAQLSALIDAHNTNPVAHANLSGAGLTWLPTGIDAVAEVGKLHYWQAATLINLQLPIGVDPGKRFGVVNGGAAARITQVAGQQILIGDLTTTPGIQGRIESINLGDWAEFAYAGAGLWIGKIEAGYLEIL